MGLKTSLYDIHRSMGGRMVLFAGWDMPLHYGSQLEEHHAVRRDAGMFDVSHMAVVDLQGPGTQDFLRYLLANDVGRLREAGKALYSCMLNEAGGVKDDLIVYFLAPASYRMVVNAGTAEKDLAWMREQSGRFEVELRPRRDLAMIAVQGPAARERTLPSLPQELRSAAAGLGPFFAAVAGDWLVARTGYTGEDGYEVMLPSAEAARFWQKLAASGVSPCGLGARDTLRLEAGMNLYGADMDEEQSPLESGLGWTIAWEPADRAFIGRAALDSQKAAGRSQRFVGLVLEGRGILRGHQRVFSEDAEIGIVTSGGFAPTLGRSIALARVAPEIGGHCTVEIRDKQLPARVVQPPFVRHGKPRIPL